MYKEFSKRDKLTLLKFVVYLINVLLILNLINIIGNQLRLYPIIIDIMIILFIFFMITFIIRRYIIKYKYMIIEEEFIIKKIIGKKEIIAVDININQIIKIKSIYSEDYVKDKKKDYKKKMRLFNNNKNQQCFYCIYQEDDKKIYFEFEPSKKMLSYITNKEQEV
ncbi:hypothetical protein EDC19_2857 [Natranaerovirga hydrolytica]|uniref:PH (Pleckstrin Homology) domain-containing protein n=1 Tax=Natranaerovirga hydrolytica TaxID=680378 RepID=A0A4R1MAL7_9FIRM|nr:hypothetical protein [Natranaerovirga hydrolytica]TCK86803.1 hypothetical protein EDC19_2857 [Natranaerovirga hydrolytica]